MARKITSINTFIDSVNNLGFLNNTKYIVNIKGNGKYDFVLNEDNGALYCNKIDMPAFTLESVAEMALSVPIEVPNNLKFDDHIDLTFYHDRKLELYTKFYRWLAHAGGAETGFNKYVREISASINIYCLDNETGNIFFAIKSDTAYPTKLSELEFEYDGGDSIPEFTVTLFAHHIELIHTNVKF